MGQSIGANLTDTFTMVAMMLVMVMVLTAPSEGCVNSCCQACLADQCGVCYKLNNNPIMCPCIGEVGVTPASDQTKQSSQSTQADQIQGELSRLSKYQLLSQKSQFSVGAATGEY